MFSLLIQQDGHRVHPIIRESRRSPQPRVSRLNTNPIPQAMAQFPFPSNLPQSTSASSQSVSSHTPTASPSGKSPVLKEQLEVAMVAPSKSRAVAVYCAASLGHHKAFQQAAICESSITRVIDVLPIINHSCHVSEQCLPHSDCTSARSSQPTPRVWRWQQWHHGRRVRCGCQLRGR